MEQAATQSWWSRNAKWAVPVTVLVVLLSIVAFVAGIFALVFGMMKSTTAYREAVARASSDPAVVAALGRPVTAGFFTTGHIRTDGSSGTARMEIPIEGPNGSAKIYVEASQSDGKWTFSKLVVELAKSGRRIDLLAPAGSAARIAPANGSLRDAHAFAYALAARTVR